MTKFGNFKGMKSKDSLERYQREPEIFLTIRHHSFPPLQQNPPKKELEKGHISLLEKDFKEKVVRGEVPLGGVVNAFNMLLKYLVIAILFPLDFAFSIAPQWIAKRVFPVINRVYNKCIEPIAKFIDRLMQPILKVISVFAFYKEKVHRFFALWSSRFSSVIARVNSVIEKGFSTVCAPFSFISQKLGGGAAHLFFLLAWGKIFAKYSFRYALDSREKLLESLEISKEVDKFQIADKKISEVLSTPTAEENNVTSNENPTDEEERDSDIFDEDGDPFLFNEDLDLAEIDDDDEEDERNAELELWDALGKEAS